MDAPGGGKVRSFHRDALLSYRTGSPELCSLQANSHRAPHSGKASRWLNICINSPVSPVKSCSEQFSFLGWYSHPLVSIRVVELHVVASLNPADGPCLFSGYRWDENSGRSSEVRCPVAQDHAGRLVDAGGVGVDGAVHLQDDNTVSETLGLTSDALDAAHCIKWQHKPQQRPEFWREERCMKTAREEGSQGDPRHLLPKSTQDRSGEKHASPIQSCFHKGE